MPPVSTESSGQAPLRGAQHLAELRDSIAKMPPLGDRPLSLHLPLRRESQCTNWRDGPSRDRSVKPHAGPRVTGEERGARRRCPAPGSSRGPRARPPGARGRRAAAALIPSNGSAPGPALRGAPLAHSHSVPVADRRPPAPAPPLQGRL